MADRLTPLDATFLELEQDDDSAHMHIGGALVFEPRADGSTPSVEEIRTHLDERLGHLPRYRCSNRRRDLDPAADPVITDLKAEGLEIPGA